MADDVAAAATATAPLPNGAGVGVGDGVEVGPGVDESSTTTSEAVPLFSPTSTMVLEGAFDDIEDMLLDGGGEEPPQQHGDTAGGSEVEEGGSAARDGGSVGLTLPPHPGAPSSATTVGRVERSASEAAASVASNTSGETTTAARTAASASRARSLSATNLTPGTYAPTNAVHMVLQENAKVPTFNLTVDRSNAAAGRSRSGSLGIKHGVFFAPSSAAATAAGAKSEADGKGQGAGREMHNNAHQQHPSQSQQQQQQHMHGGGMAPSTSRDIDEMLRLSENDANLTEMFLGSKQRSSASLAYSCAGAMLSSIGSRIGEKTTPPPPPGAGGDIATADGAGDDSKALKESSVMAASFSSPENNVGNGGQKPPTPLLLSPTIQPLNGTATSVEMKGNVPFANPLQRLTPAPHSGSKRPLHQQSLTGTAAPAAPRRHGGGTAAKGVPSIPATTAQIAPGPSQLTQHIYSYYPYGRPHPLPIPTVVSAAPNAAAAPPKPGSVPKPGSSSEMKVGAPSINVRAGTYVATGKGSTGGAVPASKGAKKQDSTIAAALNTAAVLATTKQQEALVADVPMSLPPLTAKPTSTKMKTTAPPPAVDTATATKGKGAEALAGKGPGRPKSAAEDVNVTPDATSSRNENDATDDRKSTSSTNTSSTTPPISNQSPKVVPTPASPGQPTPTPSVTTGLVPSPLAPASVPSKPQPKEPMAPNATTRSQYPVHPGHPPNGAPAPLYPLHPSYYHPHPTFHYPAPAAPHGAAHVTPSASILEAAKRRSQFGFGGNHAVASVPMPLSNVKFAGGNAAAAAAAATKNGAAARKKVPAPPPTGIPAPINPFAAPIVGSPPVDPCVAYERKKQRAKDARINMNESIERLSVAINLAGSQSKQRAAHLLPSDDTSSQSCQGAKLAESELALVKSMNDCSAAADCAKKWDRPSFVGTAATLIQNLNNQCEALMREVVELRKGQEDQFRDGTRAEPGVKAGRSLSNGSSHPNEVLVSSDCCSNDTEDLDEKRAQHAGQPCSSAMSTVGSTAAPSPKRQKVESLAPSDFRTGATSQRGATSSVIFEKKTSIEERMSRNDSSHSDLMSSFLSDGSIVRALASFLDPLSMVRCLSVSKKWHDIASFVCDEVWLGLCNKRFGVVTVRKWKSKEEDDNDEDFLIADSDQQPAEQKPGYFSLYSTMKAASVKPHCHIEGNVMLGRANIGGSVCGWVSFVERSNGETLRSVRRERTSAGKVTSYYTSLPVVELRILIQNTGSYDGCVAIPDQVISVDASTRRRSEQMDEITTDERFQKTIMRLDGSTICEGGLEPQKCSQAAALHELRLFEAAVLVAHIHARGCSTTAKFQQRAKFAKVLLSVNKTTVPLVLPFRNQDEPAG